MTLHDLLVGNIPGNPLSNISLGDANDPQFNKFSFNLIGSLGQGTGAGSNGVVDRKLPGSIFAGPYNVSMGGSAPQQQRQAPPPPNMGMQQGLPPRNQFAPIGSFNQFQDQNFPIGVPGWQQGIAPQPGMGGTMPRQQPYSQDMGYGSPQVGLMNRMLGWKG
jgi:hypothetical protein